jgi:hypothetical protein
MRSVLWVSVSHSSATASAAVDGRLVKAGDFHNIHIRVPDPPKAGEWA